jgi:hypothetical protein
LASDWTITGAQTQTPTHFAERRSSMTSTVRASSVNDLAAK